jgi:hypothetical protein
MHKAHEEKLKHFMGFLREISLKRRFGGGASKVLAT